MVILGFTHVGNDTLGPPPLELWLREKTQNLLKWDDLRRSGFLGPLGMIHTFHRGS